MNLFAKQNRPIDVADRLWLPKGKGGKDMDFNSCDCWALEPRLSCSTFYFFHNSISKPAREETRVILSDTIMKEIKGGTTEPGF